LDRPSLLKMIQMPSGAQAFFDAHADATGTILRNPRKIPVEHFEELDNEVDFADSIYEFVASRTETRATSPEQEEVYNELLNIFTQLQEIHERFPKLQLVGSNQSEALIDQYFGKITFQPINLKSL
jgi:hypothetical protein